MSFLPDINGGMKAQVYRVRSKKNIYDPDPGPSERLNVVNSKHATVSAKRQVGIREELQLIKGNYENRCFKKGSKKHKSERQARLKMEQYNWNKWLGKRNSKHTSRLTKREFKVFWAWYSSRREVNSTQHEELGGIRLDRAADDFVKIGLFENRPDACVFLKAVDTDGSGYVSFTELMEALGDASNESQVICMRQFVVSLTEKEERKKEKEAAEKAKKEEILQRKRILRKSASTSSAGISGSLLPDDNNFNPNANKVLLPSINERPVKIKRLNSC
jgi:hypothetical protein